METEFDYKKALAETLIKRGAIAEAVGVTTGTLKNWELGNSNPSKGDLLLLKKVLQNNVKITFNDDL